jgi:hypothetical protein
MLSAHHFRALEINPTGHAVVTGLSYRDIVVEGLYAPPNEVAHDPSYGLKLLDLQIVQSHYSGRVNLTN